MSGRQQKIADDRAEGVASLRLTPGMTLEFLQTALSPRIKRVRDIRDERDTLRGLSISYTNDAGWDCSLDADLGAEVTWREGELRKTKGVYA